MKRTIVFFLCVSLCAVSVGCAGRTADSDTENSDKELADEFNKNVSLLEESTGSICFGYVDPPQNGYVYDGTELEVPYYIENTGGENEQNAEVGLLFFVDGEAQPYSTNEDGKETDESYMHKFSIAPGDRLDFDAAFTPVSGKEGEEIGLIPAIIWNPDYMPEDMDSARFGNCYSLSANVPLTITMQADGSGIHTPSSKEAEITDIPEDIILSLEDTYSEGAYDFLDDSVGFEIETENDKSVLESENGKVNVTLNLYGGKQVTDKITLFIGNQPVQIEDGDYAVIHTQKDKMCQVKAQIDVKNLKEPAVMYAVAMTSGDDYITQDIYMTVPILIKGNAAETTAEEQKEENHDGTASSFRLYESETDYESNTVKIHDLVSNDLAGTITCRQDEQLVTALEVDDGFAVVKKSSDESGTSKEYENGGLVVTTDEDGSGSWTEYALELYDFDLNMVKSISLLEYIDQDKAEIHGDPVISQNGEKIAWLTNDSIYYIDLAAEKSCFADALSQENIVPVQIAFVGNDKIGFYGSQGITETDTCYGFLNLEDQRVSAHIAKDYQAGTLLTNDRYVCINDAQDPYTNKSSGKIQILDCKTDEAREVQVDGLESTFSVITEEDKMLISIKWDKENSFRIRNYDMETMDVLYETTCKKDEAVRPFEIKKAGDEYVVVYLSSEWGYVYAADH